MAKRHVVGYLFLNFLLCYADFDHSVLLSIHKPSISSGMVILNDSNMKLEVQIDIELFQGSNANKFTEESSKWMLCYYAFLDMHPLDFSGYDQAGLKTNQICIGIGQQFKLVPLDFPRKAGIPGVIEHWRLNSWIQLIDSQTSESILVKSYSKFKLKKNIENYHSVSAYQIRSERVFAELQVLFLDPETGRIPIPKNSRIWIEVGANSRNTLASVEAACEGNEDVFVISFEPLLGQYCRLTASMSEDSSTHLGRNSKGITLPFAVGSQDGEKMPFFVSSVDGCSSLLSPNQDKEGNQECLDSTETRMVPIMSLEKLISLLPDHSRIDFLKVDTQGTALDVVGSAGRFLDRIDSVLVDTLIDNATPLYSGQNSCIETIEKFTLWNFYIPSNAKQNICDHAYKKKNMLLGANSLQDELNVFFARDPLRWRPVCTAKGESFHLREVEDLFMVGAPNQVRKCNDNTCIAEAAHRLACDENLACSFAMMHLQEYRAPGAKDHTICFCDQS